MAGASRRILIRFGGVLSPGQSVEATNKYGSIKITYVSAVRRKYEWGYHSKVIRLRPRGVAFRGMMGLYDPGDTNDLYAERLIIQESELDLENYDEAYKFLLSSVGSNDWVYTSDGLVVGFNVTPGQPAVHVNLFQLLVRGERPHRLRGARPDSIRLVSK
jgi:hypothetical protein